MGLVSALLLTALLAPFAAPLRAEDGGRGSNRLGQAASPYLRLHADNPVDWYPWGPEALERARREDRPIFLSVGYSTCHWCHVMEREVFSDPAIAALMNRFFVNIKVDREERPDLDRTYMTATQVMTGQGGWPNSVFLTPELEPFFAGTYFPPVEIDGRPGFPQILRALHQAWGERPAEVRRSAARIAAVVRRLEAPAPNALEPGVALVGRALDAVKARYDAENGGFGAAPKFPPAMRLDFLLDAWGNEADEAALDMALHTLEALAGGGIRDHLGGGFHRYTVDAAWRLPHFEKMLYNQALLARVLLKAHRLSGDPRWRDLALETLRFATRHMTTPDGAFVAAWGAESEGEEGRYYLWTETQIEETLGDDAAFFLGAYRLEPLPGADGGVVHRPAYARAVNDRLERLRRQLLQRRERRPRPFVDDKVLAAWNGLMISALAQAGTVDPGGGHLAAAGRAASFVLDRMRREDGRLRRAFRDGRASGTAYLEDYVYTVEGLLRLYEAGGEPRWLKAAAELADTMTRRLWDAEHGGFFFAEAAADALVRGKNARDTALPAPNAVAARSLLDLARWTGRPDYRERAVAIMTAFGGAMNADPAGHISLVSVAARHLGAYPAGAVGPAADLVRVRAGLAPGAARGDTFAAGDTVSVELALDIADGWHINPNPAGDEWLLPTVVGLDADFALEAVQTAYPPGRLLNLNGSAKTVYDRRLRLATRFRLGPAVPPGRGTLRLDLHYQACDATRCLPPARWRGRVTLQVAAPDSARPDRAGP